MPSSNPHILISIPYTALSVAVIHTKCTDDLCTTGKGSK